MEEMAYLWEELKGIKFISSDDKLSGKLIHAD